MEELIPTLQEEGEERIDTLQEGSIIAGVQTINGKAGDLDLKTINGQDILTPGNLSLATTDQLATKQDALTETQLAAVNSGIDSSKVQQIADNTTAIAGKQDQLTQTQLNAVNSGIDQTKVAQIATNTGNITSNTNRITTIEGKIPSAATSTNQLTDKSYVDNAIATNTADYISDNGQPFQSLADLEAYSGPLTNNDYAFVVSTDSAGNLLYTRYKYNADQELWAEEYTIANPTFTSTQWAAIDSGVTANDVSQIGTNKSDIAILQSGKQDKLTTAQQAAVDSGIDATKVQQIATNTSNITSLQTDKQDKLIAGTNIQIAADGKTISATDTTYTAGTGLTLTGTQFSVTEPVPTGFFTDTQGTQEGEGTTITLNNTADAPIDNVELKGDTEQTTYAGKNLWGGFANNFSKSFYGIDYVTNTDGTITVSAGTVSGGTSYSMSSADARNNHFVLTLPAGIYTISGAVGDVSAAVVESATGIQVAMAKGQETPSFTLNEETGVFVRANIVNGTTVPATTLRPMINAGSTPGDYEPYTGSTPTKLQPSPNPDYPQDIQVVTGEQTVTVTGKNIWNPTPYQENHFIAADGTESTNTSTNTWGNIYVPTGTRMTVSATPSTTTSTAIRVHAFTLDGVWKEQVAVLTLTGGNYGSETFTTPNEPVLLRWCGAKNLASYQLEYSSTASTYQPFQGQSYTIDFTPIELCKIGTYQDYIWKDGSDWKVHKAIGKMVLDGTEGSWNRVQVNGVTRYFTVDATGALIVTDTSSLTPVVCDNFTSQTPSNIHLAIPDYGISLNTGTAKFRFRDKDYTETSDFKTWLTTHNTTVYYALATPTDTAITDAALVAQFDALASSTTYAPQTNYTTSTASPNLPAILTVDVFKNNYAGLLARLNKAGA